MKHIYVLHEICGPVRYVGCSKNPAERVRLHWSQRFKRKSPVAIWLQSLSTPPEYSILETVTDEAGWDAEAYYISLLKQIDTVSLLNLAVSHYDNGQTGRSLSPEHCEKLRQAGLKLKVSDETREKIRTANVGKKHTPEAREKMRQAALRRAATPEGKERLRQMELRRWNKSL